jgi:uncharacterized lipoprotein YajG
MKWLFLALILFMAGCCSQKQIVVFHNQVEKAKWKQANKGVKVVNEMDNAIQYLECTLPENK